MNDNNSASLSVEEKWALMTRDIQRGAGEQDYVVGEDEIRDVLALRDVRLYWGTGESLSPPSRRPFSLFFQPRPGRRTWATLCP